MNSNYILNLGHDQLWFNSECINHFSEYPFVQIFLNAAVRQLIIRPCKSIEPAAIPWINSKNKTRTVTCHIFFAQLCALINYTGIDTLKVTGTLLLENDNEYLVFDLPVYSEGDNIPSFDNHNAVTSISVIYLVMEKINEDYYFYRKTNTGNGGKTSCRIMNLQIAT